MQDYIDAQCGGPGKGFYRIVTSPWEARRVINAGKMAIVMGIETSVPFGCTSSQPGDDVPTCDPASIDRQLDEVHALGVRQMELVNKFDNALSGVAGDNGEVGVAVNSANFRETNSFWDMRHCEPENPDAHDKNQLAAPGDQRRAAGRTLRRDRRAVRHDRDRPADLPAARPLQRARPDHARRADHRRPRRSAHALRPRPHERQGPQRRARPGRGDGLLRHHVQPLLVDRGRLPADLRARRLHRAVRRRLDRLRREVARAPRLGRRALLLRLRVRRRHERARRPGQPPRRRRVEPGHLSLHRPRRGHRRQAAWPASGSTTSTSTAWRSTASTPTGSRTCGWSPAAPSGDAIVEDMARGAEAYLQTWERAEGIAPDSCRNPGLRKSESAVRGADRRGHDDPAGDAGRRPALHAASAARYTFCARTATEPEVRMRVTFGDNGRVTGISRA